MLYSANELDLLEASSLPDRQPILSVHLVLSSTLDLSRLYQALQYPSYRSLDAGLIKKEIYGYPCLWILPF